MQLTCDFCIRSSLVISPTDSKCGQSLLSAAILEVVIQNQDLSTSLEGKTVYIFSEITVSSNITVNMREIM